MWNARLRCQFQSHFTYAWLMFSSVLAKRYQTLARNLLLEDLFPVSFVPSRYSKLLNFHCFMICEVVLLNHASCHFIHAWCKTLQVITKSEIRAACTQVLFSAVYHLKSIILPYSMDLLKVSIKALQKGSEKVLELGFNKSVTLCAFTLLSRSVLILISSQETPYFMNWWPIFIL